MLGISIILDENILIALRLTVMLELFVILLIPKRTAKLALLSVFTNIITNTSFNIVIAFIPYMQSKWIVAGLEIVIVFIETLIYFALIKNFKRALLISFLCNFASYLVGLLLIPYIY